MDCWHCDTELIWGGDQDIKKEGYGDYDIVTNLSCPECHTFVVVYHPSEKMKENEEKVLNAVRILFESAEDIEIFNKKAIYLYMREITGLNTKQVVNNLNKMRVKYAVFRKKWDKGEL